MNNTTVTPMKYVIPIEGGQEITLTEEQAKGLYDSLHRAFGCKEPAWVPWWPPTLDSTGSPAWPRQLEVWC